MPRSSALGEAAALSWNPVERSLASPGQKGTERRLFKWYFASSGQVFRACPSRPCAHALFEGEPLDSRGDGEVGYGQKGVVRPDLLTAGKKASPCCQERKSWQVGVAAVAPDKDPPCIGSAPAAKSQLQQRPAQLLHLCSSLIVKKTSHLMPFRLVLNIPVARKHVPTWPRQQTCQA